MSNTRNRFPARRRFLKQSAALSGAATLASTAIVLAQARAAPIKAGASEPETKMPEEPARLAKSEHA